MSCHDYNQKTKKEIPTTTQYYSPNTVSGEHFPHQEAFQPYNLIIDEPRQQQFNYFGKKSFINSGMFLNN